MKLTEQEKLKPEEYGEWIMPEPEIKTITEKEIKLLKWWREVKALKDVKDSFEIMIDKKSQYPVKIGFAPKKKLNDFELEKLWKTLWNELEKLKEIL